VRICRAVQTGFSTHQWRGLSTLFHLEPVIVHINDAARAHLNSVYRGAATRIEVRTRYSWPAQRQ
jgi:hypothetical protein